MNIEIREKHVADYSKARPKRLYVVVINGKRVDSFLRKSNAQRKVRQFREDSRSANQGH